MGAVREAFLAAYRAALRAVDPYSVTKRFLSGKDPWKPGGREIENEGGVRILAVGKGAYGMAEGAIVTLGDRFRGGLIIADHVRPSPHPLVRVMVGDHPYPGRASLEAGREALGMVRQVPPVELLLVLVSGGGSALMEVPAPGITFSDLQETGKALVTGGVPITEMNIVRRHLSATKNGGLARAATGRGVASLLISDVVDGPPSAIASGPTLADHTTRADARAVLADHGLDDMVPARVMEYLKDPRPLAVQGGEHPYQVIADGSMAARAAHGCLELGGHRARVVLRPLTGDAEEEARSAVEMANPGRVDVYWGETTVRIAPATAGRGGRNQHAALVAAGLLSKRPGGVFGAFATDGVDGQSDGAGGLVDHSTVARGRAGGWDYRDHLARFDSSPYLAACGDQVVTGPTGANVGDLWLVTG